jgi:NADH dehydrogenase FAD-containing subunit
MKLQELSLYLSFVKIITTFTFRFAIQRVQSVIHRHTYRASPNPRNVVVVGGSFAGSYLVQRLANTLPSGYRVVLLEKQSHFNHAFAFPRNSVFSGRESKAFIPYDNIADGAPEGIFQRVCDEALEVTETDIEMASGNRLSYDYLVIATGAAQPPPARLKSHDREGCITELQGFQQRISKAERIAVVGGGAVGVELITEIREKYPDKKLTLIHSRDQLLPRFGAKLHEFVISALRAKNIEVLLKERPALPPQSGQAVGETQIALSNGEKRIWDLIVR